MGVLAFFLFIAFVVFLIVGFTTSVKFFRAASLVCLVVGVVALVGCSFAIVPTGYTGVRVKFGQVSDENVPSGFNFRIPIVETIELINNKQQDITISTQIWGETSEKTPVYAADVTVTYQISPKKSSWIYANVSKSPDNLITSELVASSIKSAMVELTVNDVTSRAKIEPLAKEKLISSLNEKYGEDVVSVLKVVINDMDFEPEYNQAIAAKSIAQQTYERQKIENETAIAKADADKKVAITNAEAKAEADVIAAQAQADANRLLSESITESTLKSKFYDKWDGKLPTVLGNSELIADIGSLGN